MTFKKSFVSILVSVGLLGLVVWGFVEGRKEFREEQERERPVRTASRVTLENGETVITLDASTLAISGIEVVPLQAENVPSAAVIWWEGKKWVYRQKAGRFVRSEASAVHPGDRIVTRGAELLLSEEFRARIQVVGEEGE